MDFLSEVNSATSFVLVISSDYFNKDLNSFQVNGRIVLQKQQF